jgi:hypothetical protein
LYHYSPFICPKPATTPRFFGTPPWGSAVGLHKSNAVDPIA